MRRFGILVVTALIAGGGELRSAEKPNVVLIGCDLSSAREPLRFCVLPDAGNAPAPVAGGL